jgi:hypothetical protein
MEQRAIEVVIRTFEWFNDVMTNPRHVISRKEIEHRFTEDAQMIANGQLKCAGIAAHLKHFQELQKKPLEVSISTADEAAAYYKIDYVSSEGAAGVIHDSAIWRIRDGKFALMVETVSFEGKEVPLENHS